MFDPVIAPSGTLLGLLQRGRGDGTLHALTAPRAEALAALNHCVLRDPRHDWQVENRSLYYARLFLDLNGELDEIETHLFEVDDVFDTEESRTGLALAVLGHLASYGRRDALELLRRYAASGSNWAWALDELALRDDDAGLRALAAPVLARFATDPEGEAELAAVVRDAFEPRPWRLWADDPRESVSTRVRAAQEAALFRPLATPDATRRAAPRVERAGRLRVGPAGPRAGRRAACAGRPLSVRRRGPRGRARDPRGSQGRHRRGPGHRSALSRRQQRSRRLRPDRAGRRHRLTGRRGGRPRLVRTHAQYRRRRPRAWLGPTARSAGRRRSTACSPVWAAPRTGTWCSRP